MYLGASQMIESHFPALRETLKDEEWRFLIEDFVRKSAWESNHCADLVDEFNAYLARESA